MGMVEIGVVMGDTVRVRVADGGICVVACM